MPFKVQVGPHQVSIHHGQTVLVSEPDGQIPVSYTHLTLPTNREV